MSGLFISYRRADTEHAAGRLADNLIREFGSAEVFMDVDAIEPGVDFVRQIQQALAQCRVMLVVIGDTWLTATDSKARRRLELPDDHVRIEIATALQKEGVRVIPVLVGGAEIPGSDELPEDLAALARRNAVELRHGSWHQDVVRLITKLQLFLTPPAAEEQPTLLGRGDSSDVPSPGAREEGMSGGGVIQPRNPELGASQRENATHAEQREAPRYDGATERQTATARAAARLETPDLSPPLPMPAAAGSAPERQEGSLTNDGPLGWFAPMTRAQRFVTVALGALVVGCVVFVIIMLISIPDEGSQDVGLQAALATAGSFLSAGIAVYLRRLVRNWRGTQPSSHEN